MITEVVPSPTKCTGKICEQFRAAIQEHGLPKTHAIFEGYLNALVFSYAARCAH
ncbi:hypothetical protein [Pseudoalteromonas phenolica]|uniref:hypothetical protein n=1 Tax=Pseudoalteromonas phenolica TaxID=161398 RepID=UPI001486D57D|nr:hypothetical protein [Pseudoalteromonas phenolica]